MTIHNPFPGTKSYPGWRYLYIEADSKNHYLKIFDEIGNYIENSQEPVPDGRFVTANSVLTLPTGKTLYGLAIGGDVSFFEAQITEFASQRGLELARIRLPVVSLESGIEYAFSDCETGYFSF
jgi:hypothetical protein